MLIELLAGGLLIALMIAVCTVIEQFAVIERYPLRSRLPGLAMNLVQGPLMIMVAWPIQNFWYWLGIGKIIVIPLWSWLAPLGGVGYAIQILAVVLAADFLAYWRHRTEHKLFWPIHMVHHSPTELHAANNIGHPLLTLFNLAFIWIPLSLIQIEGPAVPGMVSFFVLLSTYYIHSPVDVHFGPFRKVLVDNRFHRIHHSTDPRHFDRNFGICFSLWDRMFGTAYEPAPGEWPDVGLAGVVPPRSVGAYLLMPFRKTRGEAPAAAGHSDAAGAGGAGIEVAS
jgi:sterol desaturase/sphingolipid hydroxylase (fatty acid hydroxylase superfamily)